MLQALTSPGVLRDEFSQSHRSGHSRVCQERRYEGLSLERSEHKIEHPTLSAKSDENAGVGLQTAA